jgi:uncharacterized protein (DUF924 family)
MKIKPQDVIDYWLGDAQTDPSAAEEKSKLWYGSSGLIDKQIRRVFGEALVLAESGALKPWQKSPDGQLALVILLDQFTRNVNRGSKDAWKNDARALTIASRCVEKKDHQALSYFGRVFLYHPFHHAESSAAQQKAVNLFDELFDEVPPEWQAPLKGHVDFAHSHSKIVLRFGRFPHRNETLGRASTPEEIEYLTENNRKYGQ